jgi:hypothetical protein
MKLKTTNHAERLKKWAENIETFSTDLSHWGDRKFVIAEMRRIADDFDALKEELNSARGILEDVGHGFNCAHAARAYLKAHPEPEGEGK